MKNQTRVVQENRYFELRNVNLNDETHYTIPKYIRRLILENKNLRILDIGCGSGGFLLSLKKEGYNNLIGIDISEEAYLSGKKHGLQVIKIDDILDYSPVEKFDFFYMNHVLEHIEKDKIIPTLRHIKEKILKPDGKGMIIVPNAQSNTGSYWAYEDFTHHLLFTSGSLFYVLKSAGFSSVDFIDKSGLSSSRPLIRILKIIGLFIYKANKKFWNRVTASSFHKPSPEIYTFDIKAFVKN